MPEPRDRRPAPTPATFRRRRAVALGTLSVVIVLVAAIVTSGGDEPARGDAPAQRAAAATVATSTIATGAAGPGTQPVATGPQITGDEARRARIPILMYHVIATPPPGQPMSELWVPKKRFRSQVEALRRAGYEAVTMDQATDAWRDGAPLPEKPIVLTFDDGYLSQSTAAGPILEKLGWPGVLYLTTRNIGPTIKEGSVRKLMKAGWELGAHTVTHPDLTTLDAAGLQREIDDGRIELQARFGAPVDAFCYPTGANDERVRAAVKAAGFRTATTVVGGIAGGDDDPYALPRVRVNPEDTPKRLLEKIDAFGRGAVAADGPQGYSYPASATG